MTINTAGNADRRMTENLILGLADLTRQRIEAGFEPSLLTLMFARLPGNPAAVIGHMRDEATRVFSALITRVVRDPRRFVGFLPIMFAAPDLPVAKRNRPAGDEIALNGGLHMHGVLLMPQPSRLKTSVAEHFRVNEGLYLRDRSRLDRIDVRPITHAPERVVAYALKSLRRGRVAYDDVLILPRSVAELPD